MEKISDFPKRKEKVKRLKEKILFELGREMRLAKRDMLTWLMEEYEEEEFNFLLKVNVALMELKSFVEQENSFMRYTYQNDEEDIIIYCISEEKLDIWLQDGYSFVSNYLLKIYDHEYQMTPFVDEEYFAYNFTNLFDIALYHKKQEGKI